MYVDSHFSPVEKFAKIAICLVTATFLFSCQPIHATPVDVIQISPEPYLTETPVPACVSLPDIKLSIELLSENSVHLTITGLVPNEPVYTIFSSEFKGSKRTIGCCEREFADENGVYEYSVGLRGQDVDAEFKEWQVWVIHSRGSTCTEFALP
jgi:hypothetical protein